ncbi:hypothetical protein GBA52_010472 [Prunus armeniaca]|nr:hypothetical protein GBA52_010472 [Prunus armeniaca]
MGSRKPFVFTDAANVGTLEQGKSPHYEKLCSSYAETVGRSNCSDQGAMQLRFHKLILKGSWRVVASPPNLVVDGAKEWHFCLAIKSTVAHVLSLKGDDGVKVKAVAICHLDTSEWNPKHLAFQILKVKPGKILICHFLPTDHIVWVPNHKSA